jgi:aminopeptidase N
MNRSAIVFGLLTILMGTAFVRSQTVNFDVKSYDAEIEPELSTKSVKGKVSIKFRALIAGLTEIRLNAGALEIDGVREGKTDLKFEKKEGLLEITLARPAKLNAPRRVEIEYHGTPRFGVRFFPEQSQVYTIFSTSQWMPCVDAPEDRAAFRLSLIRPRNVKMTANGDFLGETALANNKIRSVWERKNPVPTYLYGFAFGDFLDFRQKHQGVTFRYLAGKSFSIDDLRNIFISTADMLDFFKAKAGVEYTEKTYTQVLALGSAEQEMADFTALNEDYGRGVLKDEKAIWLGAHEFAHQWWGNLVTNRDWTHFWLNEGIATFMTAAYLEHRFGEAEYMINIERSKMRYEKVREEGKDKSLVFPDWNRPTREDRRLVYDKGAYVVHLLRRELGDRLFWKGFKAYTQKFRGKSVTTADFQTTMEKSTGKDLAAFFDRWVYLKTKPK